MSKLLIKDYIPHQGQAAFHHYMNYFRFLAVIAGIRGGKTVSGARESVKQAWNATGKGVFGIVAPTYNMLDRTTWVEFREAAEPLIKWDNDTKKIIELKNGRRIHGHSADKPDRIRNETFVGFWVDEARECKDFAKLWKVLQGRVLSTGGKGFITTTPNSFDDIYDIFIANPDKDYGVIQFPTFTNTHIKEELISQLESSYDEKFAAQELKGEFVVFEGQVYYTFNRDKNAGSLAYKVANYEPSKPLHLCCDFNVNPMAWVIAQVHEINDIKHVYVIDEVFIKNSNTIEACREVKSRYPNHTRGIVLHGDATGQNRSSNSNVTNWMIVKEELANFGITDRVPRSNPAERDRINAVNGLICNSRGERRVQINPKKCVKLISDLEQVSFKEGTTSIDKTRNLMLTHPSDAFGYMVEADFGLNRQNPAKGLKI